VVIAGLLSPAHEVAGDTFDYALNGDVAHLAVFDAMGHGMSATLLASVALGAYRNARRTGLDLVDSARSIDKWIGDQFGQDVFVTGILAELDLRTGHYRWVNAGHPPALLLRGSRIVKALDQVVSPPLSLLGEKPVPAEERLEPGDRLVLYTDGVVEARDVDGEFFGLDRLTEFISREEAGARPAPETLRRLNAAVLGHQEGELQDDATVLFVEWLGRSTGPPRSRPR
jgi:serine phosphatase RsbU (regulator of sigma subunit)